MNEPWKYYAKWKKPVTKDDSIHMKVHKGEIYRDRKLITDCLGLGGNRKEITRRQEVSFWGDKNVLKIDCGNRYIHQRLNQKPLTTLKVLTEQYEFYVNKVIKK